MYVHVGILFSLFAFLTPSGGSSSESMGGRIYYFVTMINQNKHMKKIKIYIKRFFTVQNINKLCPPWLKWRYQNDKIEKQIFEIETM